MRNRYVPAAPKRPDCFRFWAVADDSIGPGPGTDDEFDRQLRALTEGSAGEARFHELSAAERAKEGARRAKEARKQAARNARLAERAARRAPGQPSTPRRWLLGSLIIVVAVAIVSGLFWLSIGRALRGGGSGGTGSGRGSTTSAGTPSATSASTSAPPTPSTAPTASTAGAVSGPPPADPFATSPAKNWADGEAGIVIPAAHAVGGYSAAQVADAYQTTRKLLIAAALDRQTLLGGTPTAFAGLLTRQQRTQFLADLNRTGVDKHGNELSTRTMVTSFAPGTTQLIGSVIKVYGTMSARATVDQRQKVLAVDVDYRFGYAVEPPGTPTDWMRVIGEIWGSVEFGDWAQASTPFQPWVLFSNGTAGARCGTDDGYVHPDYPNSAAQQVQPSGGGIDPYSLAAQPAAGTCQPATGT
jgi:hypothetical protein